MNTRTRNLSLPMLKIETDQPQHFKSKLTPGGKPQPGRSRSKWSILTQQKPEAELFATDEQRSIHAYNALEKLAAETGVGDKGIDTLNSFRSSDLYLDIKHKLERNEKLVLSEYLYYALTTENVNNISIELLEAATKRKDAHGFEDNLQVLLAILKWQHATSPEEKNELNIQLHKSFLQRGYHDRQGYRHCEYYLNLHGINLSGADLTFAALDYTDLGSANLSGCDLSHAYISFSSLDHANLTRAFARSPGNPHTESGTKIQNTHAMDAIFDGFQADNISLKYSDFTGATFTNADLCIGISYDNDATVTFDFADFTNAHLRFAKQRDEDKNIFVYFRFAKMINCIMHNTDSATIDLAGAELFPNTIFNQPDQYRIELSEVDKRFVQPIFTEEHSQKEKERRITGMKRSIARALVDQIDNLLLPPEKSTELVQLALEHPAFSNHGSILPARIGTFFNSVSATVFGPAKSADDSPERIFEAELNRLSGLKSTTTRTQTI